MTIHSSYAIFLQAILLLLGSSSFIAIDGLSSPQHRIRTPIQSIDASETFQQWPSSLPVPENCECPQKAQRAIDAMAGPDPTALEGRCKVALGKDGVRFVHVDPPVLVVDGFLTQEECTNILQLTTSQIPPDAGRVIKIDSRSYADVRNQDDGDNSKVSAETDTTTNNNNNNNNNNNKNVRSSTTWYVRYGCSAVTPLLNGISDLLPDINLEQVEEIQIVRYAGSGQGFAWHEDSLDMDVATPDAGGQRIATCLVYLDECDNGRTIFRDLVGDDNKRLAVSPKTGRALLFFPSATGITSLGDAASAMDSQKSQQTFGECHFDNTRADRRTSHAGEPPAGVGSRREKHIAQLWIHSSDHTPVVFGRGLNRHDEAKL